MKKITVYLEDNVVLQLGEEAKNSFRTRKKLIEYIIDSYINNQTNKPVSNQYLKSNESINTVRDTPFLAFDDLPTLN